MSEGETGKSRADQLEVPALEVHAKLEWGSDVVAQVLRDLDIPFIALVPGSSFRGLHDSLVNYLGNRNPQLIVCLHEEHAVAIADGYARVMDKPMAVALHSNVGLMHAAMPIYNAWCDRVPMLILGATGPVDAHERRPWIDWVHTSRDQGALIRNYVKWDDQPASAEAAVESVLRAYQIAATSPCAPTYVCLDVTWQEQKLASKNELPDVRRFQPARPSGVRPDDLSEVFKKLKKAKRPLFLMGRVSRDQAAWDQRVQLAETLGAAVMSSMHDCAAFPTMHPQHVLPVCGEARTEAERDLVKQSDLIISFDWLDLAGFLRSCTGNPQALSPITTDIVQVSLDHTLANGWSMDHQSLPAIDIHIQAHPDHFTAQLLDAPDLDVWPAKTDWDFAGTGWVSRLDPSVTHDEDEVMDLGGLATEIMALLAGHDVTFIRFPLGWPRIACRFDHPLSYLGKDGGAAVGVGPGNAVGAALALDGTGRLPVAVLGDGDTTMGINALWSAAHLDLPLLIIVANNNSYFNDERHQERVAKARGRPVENRWIGQRLTDPEVDLCAMARAQGFLAYGPVRTRHEFSKVLTDAADQVAAGERVLIDARILPGYASDFGLET